MRLSYPKLNGDVKGIFAYGQGGDDDIDVAGSINLPTKLYGDSGNDPLKGGAGPSLLLGGAGDDQLVGGNGRSVLIGGTGADQLVGGSGDDILIASSTQYEVNPEALCAIFREWTRTDLNYTQRVQNLQTGVGRDGTVKLTAATVFGDGAKDRLTGGAGQDWFSSDGTDKLTDWQCTGDCHPAQHRLRLLRAILRRR